MNSVKSLTATCMLLLVSAAFGTDNYDMSWHTIDCGGGRSTALDYELHGAIGQHDAGIMTGDSFTLEGGFWSRGEFTPQVTCPADLSIDGQVDVTDLLMLLQAWGPCQQMCKADLTGDDEVNVSDLLFLLSAWGLCP